jgi:hypothetical protein
MKLSTEKLLEALELISLGVTRPTKIAAALGLSYRAYCQWMVRSNNQDELFLVEFNGETMQFAKAITLATKLALFELRGMIVQQSIFGYPETMTKDGQVVWALDPAAAALDPEDREWLGFRKDALLEVDGKLVPLVLQKKAPFAQQIRMLEAAFPDLRPTQTVIQNVALSGVVGVGVAKVTDYSKRPVVTPPPLPPVLPAPSPMGAVDAEFNEVDDLDLDADDAVPALVPVAPINISIAVEQPEDEPRPVPGPSPEQQQQQPPRARSALEHDLWSQLEKQKQKTAASAAARKDQTS